MKFLATPAAANAWAKEGGFVTGNHNVSLGALPGRDRPRRPACRPDGEAGRVRHVGRAAGGVRLDDRPGRVGAVPDVPARTRATRPASRSSSRALLRRPTSRASNASMSAGGITAEPPVTAAPPARRRAGRSAATLTGGAFLAPALFLLFVWLVYPTVYTIVRSFFGPSGYVGNWVGIDNYKTLFTTSTLTTAIKNNAIWVAVVPATVCAIGLDLRRPDREDPLGGRVQDGDLPADGDLGLRDRRHLADHVPAGSRPRGDQRALEDRSPASSARPASCRARSPRPRSCRRPRRARSC